MTAYGRKVDARRLPVEPPLVLSAMTTVLDRERAKRAPRWVYVLGIHAICLVVLFLIVHLTGGAIRAERNSSQMPRKISQKGPREHEKLNRS